MTLGNTAKSDSELITSAIDKLRALRSEMVDAPDAAGDAIPAGGSPLISATNLMHYGMLRRHDLRELQVCLAKHGVTHFSQIESDVLKTIDAVIHLLTPDKEPTAREQKWPIDLEIAQQILDSRTSTLYGEDETGRDVRIMVTLPTEAADDYRLVREMVAAGTNAVRINCAQGRKKSWAKMIANVRKAEKDCGRACRIMMDLAGPKLRTGPMVVGRKYARIRPEREDDGLQVRPAHIWLSPNEAPPVEVPDVFPPSCRT